MTRSERFWAGTGIGLFVIYGAVTGFLVACWITGLYLAFAAAVWVGIVLFFVPPGAAICGLAYWLGGVDLPARFIQWLG